MSIVKKEVEVSQSADQLVQGLVKFAVEVKKALADGFQPGGDLPVLISAVVTDLIPVIGSLSQIGPEFNENHAAFIKAFGLGAFDLLAAFTEKKEAPPAAAAPQA